MQRIRWEELVDMIPDLNGQAIAHFYDIGVRHVFVGAGAQEGDLGIHEGKVVLDELHVQRVALETVNKDRQVQRDLEWAFRFTLSRLGFLGVGVFNHETEVFSFIYEVLADHIRLELQFASLENQLLLVLLMDVVNVFRRNTMISDSYLLRSTQYLPHLLLPLHVQILQMRRGKPRVDLDEIYIMMPQLHQFP